MSHRTYTRWMITAVTCVFLSANTLAEIHYIVRPLPATKQVEVEVTIPTKSDKTQIQLPRWMPGYYVLANPNDTPKDISAQDATGNKAEVTAVDDHTWQITAPKSKSIKVKYKTALEWENDMGHYSGTPTYIYAVGRTQEACSLDLQVPSDWRVAVGLDGSNNHYKAKTYDVLADNSVTMGKFVERTYTVDGKLHTIAVRGSGAQKVDLKTLQEQCEFVSKCETDFMGGAPYNKYVWHLNVRDGNGGGSGIEHLSSTEISLRTNLSKGTLGLFAHEFFHLWNVKRIRSKVLGPFDYTKLPKTGALWWLEGVTEYYSQSILWRYNGLTDDEYFADMTGNVRGQQTNPERLRVSPYESSYRVDETNNGRGNSDGYGMSYYIEGYVVGLCLDLELLAKTNGKSSLDDVEFALWKMCQKDRPGFGEDEIRKQLIRFGGESFGPLYDKIVMQPGNLPIKESLDHIGMEIAIQNEQRVEVGFITRATPEKNGMEVMQSKSKEIDAALPVGTIIRSVNGKQLRGETPQAIRQVFGKATRGIKAGDKLTLSVLLPGKTEESDVTTEVISLPFATYKIQSVSSPSEDQLRLRKLFASKRRK